MQQWLYGTCKKLKYLLYVPFQEKKKKKKANFWLVGLF